MSRRKNPTLSYLFHKATGQVRVRLKIDGRFRDVYLGEYGSPESREKHHRLLAEHSGGNGYGQREPVPTPPGASAHWTVAELAVKYDDFASRHYGKNGESTDDRPCASVGR